MNSCGMIDETPSVSEAPPQHPYISCQAYGRGRHGCHRHSQHDDTAYGDHVGQRNHKQQSQGIAYLCDYGNEVALYLRDARLAANHIQQGLVVIQIGHGETCHD